MFIGNFTSVTALLVNAQGHPAHWDNDALRKILKTSCHFFRTLPVIRTGRPCFTFNYIKA
jgi:hypothetical protein